MAADQFLEAFSFVVFSVKSYWPSESGRAMFAGGMLCTSVVLQTNLAHIIIFELYSKVLQSLKFVAFWIDILKF
jgi:hypothetical protein